ncbi:hypothetical protein Bpro_1472 [Polaromonas sp. JS666]|nr:hypothetical protein Bpro_1472 [Polaromonas sp. JS666]
MRSYPAASSRLKVLFIFLIPFLWTRRDSNPYQQGDQGFESAGRAGNWKRTSVGTRHRSEHLHPQPCLPTHLSRPARYYPACR